MSIQAQALYDAGAVREQVTRFAERLRGIRQLGTTPEQLQRVLEEYYNFIEGLGLPRFDGKLLDPRELATFQRLNEIFVTIGEDIKALYHEYKSIAATQAATFNRVQSILGGVQGALQNALGTVLTGAISGDVQQHGHFVVLEDFKDDSRVAPGSDAELGFGGGSLTLRKTSIDPIDMTDAGVDVKADNAQPLPIPTGVNLAPEFRDPYEGKYLAPLGEAEFEGGRLHIVSVGDALQPAKTSLADLKRGREALLDGQPNSYHQVERVVRTNRKELDPAELDSNYPYDFSVAYTFDMHHPVQATTIVLDPLNTGERAWLEVVDIQTSSDGQAWESIPGLHDYQYYNILTDEANKELTGRQVNAVLAPSKYAFTGKGLWIFGQREFQWLRVVVLQRSPVPATYEVLAIKQERQVVKSKKAPRVLGIKIGSDKTKTSTETKERELSYEESLLVFSGEESIEGGRGSFKSSNGVDVSILGHDIFSAGGTSVEKGAWAVTGQRLVVKSDAVRYVVGIRDLQVLSAEYAESSVYVSNAWTIPVPIRQVSLRADQVIPASWDVGDWVKYYISVDGGTSWQPIAPLDQPPTYRDEKRVPVTVLVNSNAPKDSQDDKFGYLDPGTPVRSIQVRIELSRPDVSGETPIVRRFALEILTQETVDQVIV